jgi:hypothetical protein
VVGIFETNPFKAVAFAMISISDGMGGNPG